MVQQPGWTKCCKCLNLVFAGSSAGSCAGGGPHANATSFDYVLAANDSWAPQHASRYTKCEVLVSLEIALSGTCAAGGIHNLAQDFTYSLLSGASAPPTGPQNEGSWFTCEKCYGLAFIPKGATNGICPAGGSHQQENAVPVVFSCGVFWLFGHPVSAYTTDALHLRNFFDSAAGSGQGMMDSLAEVAQGMASASGPATSGAAAAETRTHQAAVLSATPVDPHLVHLVKAASVFTQLLAFAQSTSSIVQQALNLQNQIDNSQATLRDKGPQAQQQGSTLRRQIDVVAAARRTVNDIRTLHTAIDETATATGLLGRLLTILGSAISLAFPVLAPLGAYVAKLGADLGVVVATEKTFSSDVEKLIDPPRRRRLGPAPRMDPTHPKGPKDRRCPKDPKDPKGPSQNGNARPEGGCCAPATLSAPAAVL
jgi:hypothetical protein